MIKGKRNGKSKFEKNSPTSTKAVEKTAKKYDRIEEKSEDFMCKRSARLSRALSLRVGVRPPVFLDGCRRVCRERVP